MFQEIKINGITLPRPNDDLVFKDNKMTTEYETEAGTVQVFVRRASKLTVSGNWTLTGKWMEQFRVWAQADTVMVEVYFPSKSELTAHECQFSIGSEKHIRYSRDQLKVDGLYEVSATMEEL
ncbi:MAG: hypothetical protein Q4F24_04145 [Eubacteriales bacterium]|nr:hypothetical protein [Eubacteriales bacterium]